MMSVQVSLQPRLGKQAGDAVRGLLLPTPISFPTTTCRADGKRFLMLKAATRPRPGPIVVVQTVLKN